MIVNCWSPKGGSGTSVVAAGLAIVHSSRCSALRHTSTRTLVVDLSGDIPAILGMDQPPLGVSDWITQPSAFDVGSLFTRCAQDLHVLARGCASLPDGRSRSWSRLASDLASLSHDGWTIIVDSGSAPAPHELKPAIERDYLVIRPCYLALRRAALIEHSSTDVIVVGEPDRVLTTADVAKVLGLPIATTLPHSPDIARRVDAGIVATRPAADLTRSLALVVDAWHGP